jgi:predicted alpha/beta-hydrolase family hydrolase
MASARGVVPFEKDSVRGVLHRHDGVAQGGLALTHGAGGNCNAPLLVSLSEAFAAAGVCVLRCDLPFRQKRRSGPPSPASAAADRAGLERNPFTPYRILRRRSSWRILAA